MSAEIGAADAGEPPDAQIAPIASELVLFGLTSFLCSVMKNQRITLEGGVMVEVGFRVGEEFDLGWRMIIWGLVGVLWLKKRYINVLKISLWFISQISISSGPLI